METLRRSLWVSWNCFSRESMAMSIPFVLTPPNFGERGRTSGALNFNVPPLAARAGLVWALCGLVRPEQRCKPFLHGCGVQRAAQYGHKSRGRAFECPLSSLRWIPSSTVLRVTGEARPASRSCFVIHARLESRDGLGVLSASLLPMSRRERLSSVNHRSQPPAVWRTLPHPTIECHH